MRRIHRLIPILLACWLGAAVRSVPAEPDAATWVLVESQAGTLSVLQGRTVVEKFEDIALGRGGAAPKRKRGDDRTPLGEFHIAWINRNSPFHVFFGLDYPGLDDAERGYHARVIDKDTYYTILDALRAGRIPPQNTLLGGRIGIHGLGRGSLKVHREFNWTEGCVALTNEEIDRLARWVQVGTRVVIR